MISQAWSKDSSEQIFLGSFYVNEPLTKFAWKCFLSPLFPVGYWRNGSGSGGSGRVGECRGQKKKMDKKCDCSRSSTLGEIPSRSWAQGKHSGKMLMGCWSQLGVGICSQGTRDRMRGNSSHSRGGLGWALGKFLLERAWHRETWEYFWLGMITRP